MTDGEDQSVDALMEFAGRVLASQDALLDIVEGLDARSGETAAQLAELAHQCTALSEFTTDKLAELARLTASANDVLAQDVAHLREEVGQLRERLGD